MARYRDVLVYSNDNQNNPLGACSPFIGSRIIVQETCFLLAYSTSRHSSVMGFLRWINEGLTNDGDIRHQRPSAPKQVSEIQISPCCRNLRWKRHTVYSLEGRPPSLQKAIACLVMLGWTRRMSSYPETRKRKDTSKDPLNSVSVIYGYVQYTVLTSTDFLTY